MRRILFLAAAVMLPLSMFAQNASLAQSTTAATDTAAAGAAPKPADPKPAPKPDTPAPDVQIAAVSPSAPKSKPLVVHLGDTVVLHVDDFAKLDGKDVHLFIEGLDAKLPPIARDPVAKKFGFQLARTSDNKELWRPILRNPVEHPTRDIRLSVGVAGGQELPSTARVRLEKITGGAPTVVFVVVVIAVTVLLVYYGRTSDMLRNGPPVNYVRQAFSLGRWQMAWWFYWIVVAYIGIWLVTGDRDTVTASLLGLMGISATTALGSVMIEASQPARDSNRRVDLQQEKSELTATRAQLAAESAAQTAAAAPAAAASATAAVAAADARVQQINQNIATVTRPSTSSDWLTDVLSDDNGTIALHRFQILAWTVVLGLIFVFTAFNDLTMPDFSATMLALMGISAGTYLGFKFPGATT